MAYILYDSLGEAMRGGPYPHKAGEFCGNVLRKNIAVLGDGAVVTMTPSALSSLPLLCGNKEAKVRIGKSAEVGGRFSSQEVEKYGYVGLYLTEDFSLPEDAVSIETDIFSKEVVSGERLPLIPFDSQKIRRREL